MDKDELWQRARALILDGVGENDPKAVFLNQLAPFGIFGDQFILQATSPEVEAFVSKNYLRELNEKVALASGRPLNVGIGTASMPAPETGDDARPQPRGSEAADAAEATAPEWMNTFVSPSDLPGQGAARKPPAAEPAGESVDETAGDEGLFEKCTFDTFVVGKSNEFARNAALAVAEQPGIAYNPLFIYGNSGLGKTHLLVAIANYAIANYPSLRTRYVSANRFLDDYMQGVLSNDYTAFNRKYSHADVLLVDDVQYLEGKGETINQFFNIFNDMTNRNKQIVLSADRTPKDIDMDDRMRSRFMSGLLADITPPDYETRLAILKSYLGRVYQQTPFSGVIPDEVLDWLAEASSSNIREMEGAITRVVSNMTLLGKKTTSVEEAKELLDDFFPNPADKQIDIATIQSEVERYFKVSHEDMVSSKRSKVIVQARHIAIYLSRQLTEESLESIGRKFGGRDHTTVMHSVHKIESELGDNRALYDQVDQLTIRVTERG